MQTFKDNHQFAVRDVNLFLHFSCTTHISLDFFKLSSFLLSHNLRIPFISISDLILCGKMYVHRVGVLQVGECAMINYLTDQH